MSRVYAHILVSLTSGLYKRVDIALREYLQNAYDAIKSARKESVSEPEDSFHVEVKITRDGCTITVSDNGIGMNKAVLEEYASIGGGTKNDPDFAGYKGIGKLAGLRFFNRFVVRTKQAGSDTGHQLTWRSGEMMKALLKDPQRMKKIPYESFIKEYLATESFSEADRSTHYTQVQLIDVLGEFRDQVSEDGIGRFIRANCPVPFLVDSFEYAGDLMNHLGDDFEPATTFLNDKVIYQVFRDKHQLVPPQLQNIKYADRLRAKVWFAWVKNTSKVIPDEGIRGIKFRCKGICVGDCNLFANNCMPEGRDLIANWFTGEVVLVDDDIKPNAARDGFEKGSELRKFYSELKKKLGKTLSNLADVRSQIHAAKQELMKLQRSQQEGKKVTSSILNKLKQRCNELKRYREKDKYSLDFGVISRLEEAIVAVETGATEKIPQAKEEIEAIIEAGKPKEVLNAILNLKKKEIETPSKKAKKELEYLIKKASAVLVKEDTSWSEKYSSERERTIVQVVTTYLDFKKVPYDLPEVERFVRDALRK